MTDERERASKRLNVLRGAWDGQRGSGQLETWPAPRAPGSYLAGHRFGRALAWSRTLRVVHPNEAAAMVAAFAE